MLPNLSSGDNPTTCGSPFPRASSSNHSRGVTVEMPSLRGEEQNPFFTQDELESGGEERKKKTKIKYWFETGSTGWSPLGVTVLGPRLMGWSRHRI